MDKQTERQIEVAYSRIKQLELDLVQLEHKQQGDLEHLSNRITQLYGIAGTIDGRLTELEQE